MKGERLDNNLYRMVGSVLLPSQAHVVDEAKLYRLWHLRLAHMSDQALGELVKRGHIPSLKMDEKELCEACVLGKQHSVSF